MCGCREAIVANAKQISEALAIDDRSIGIAHLPLHYSYGLSVVTSHLAAGARVYLLNDSITSPSFWSKIGSAGGSHFHFAHFRQNPSTSDFPLFSARLRQMPSPSMKFRHGTKIMVPL